MREAHRQPLDVTPKCIHVVFAVCEACSFHSRHIRQPLILKRIFPTLTPPSLTRPLLLFLLLCAHLHEKAIAVITGGIAEMFVSRNTETLTCLRKGFAKIALRVSSITMHSRANRIRLMNPDDCEQYITACRRTVVPNSVHCRPLSDLIGPLLSNSK